MQENLFSEFPIPGQDEWISAINKELKGRDYREALTWVTEDGIEMLPLYENAPGSLHSVPGNYPFLRGNNARGNNWEVNQEIFIGDNFVTANQAALTALNNGASSLTFNGKIEVRDDLDILLKGIEISYIQIHFRNTQDPLLLAELLKSYCTRNEIDTVNLSGSIIFDPLTGAITNGGWNKSEKEDLETTIKLTNDLREIENFIAVTVDATAFHNAGATPCQELALALSLGSYYIQLLLDSGMNIVHAASVIQFRFSSGVDIYQEISKFRAFRVLWSNMVQCYQPELQIDPPPVHAETSLLYNAQKDTYTNLLRSTSSVFSAACGGCSTITVLPFDNITDSTNHFAARMSRNIQLILQSESGLNKIADPAGGSYFIENFTKKMIEKAWDIFLGLEKENDFLTAMKAGIIQQMISVEAGKKKQKFLDGKLKMIGVNAYPNPFEKYEQLDTIPKVKGTEIPVLPSLQFENEIIVKQ